jgi:hypothetical protein
MATYHYALLKVVTNVHELPTNGSLCGMVGNFQRFHPYSDRLAPTEICRPRQRQGFSRAENREVTYEALASDPVPPLRRSPGLLTSESPASVAAFSISEFVSPPMKIAAPVKYSHSRSATTGFKPA